MPAKHKKRAISTRVGRFRDDLRALMALALFALGIAGWSWLKDHPEHNPYAPLDLRQPVGWATADKLVALRDDVPGCRAVLSRSNVPYAALPPVGPPAGEWACARPDRTQLIGIAISPNSPPVTCPVAAALSMWRDKSVAPAARDILGSELVRMEHLGAYNCRRMRGSGSGAWSQHATGNAIDIAAFVLADGRRIRLIDGWNGNAQEARFLREVRDGACGVYATVLSPDYNAAHADHFHFDQDARWTSVCR